MKTRSKTVRFLIPTLALLILMAIAAPALACKPNPTYTVGSISYPDPNNPGTTVINGNSETITGGVSTGTDYGYPWGSDSIRQVANVVLDLTTHTGTVTSCIHKTFQKGCLEIYTTDTITGVGAYIYNGPAFTAAGKDAQGNTVQVAVTSGTSFYGLLITGTGTGHGTIDHHHVETKETVTGVLILAGPLKGDTLVSGTGIYSIEGRGHEGHR
jgi:hypothetical protein